MGGYCASWVTALAAGLYKLVPQSPVGGPAAISTWVGRTGGGGGGRVGVGSGAGSWTATWVTICVVGGAGAWATSLPPTTRLVGNWAIDTESGGVGPQPANVRASKGRIALR